MKPFTYESPTSIQEATSFLADEGRAAFPLAGGTDLLVQLRTGLREAKVIVDLKRIPELQTISCDRDAGLSIGAAVSCARLCEHIGVRGIYPGLVDAASIIGGTAIRGRATLGGNLCNAAPSADTIPALMVLGATCHVEGPSGCRKVPVESFCTGPGQTVLAEGEILTAIDIPAPVTRSGGCYLRFIPRGEMDIAVAGAAAWIALNEDLSRIVDSRIALAAVAPTPLLVKEAGAALVGKRPDEVAFGEAARLAKEAARPITDVRGTAPQRRHLVGVLVRRALEGAARRARGLDFVGGAGEVGHV
jgi:carbon-monoxide dehydrogenase medium subunit